MGLQINQTYAQIGIDRTPSKLEIETESAKLQMRQKHAKIEIKRELPKVEIDQYESFASAGLKNVVDLARDQAQRGYQQIMETIGKIASDGDMLAAIEKKGDPIIEIAVRDAWPEHEFGYDYIPKAGPKITVTGSLEIKPEIDANNISGVESTYIPGEISFQFTPAKINIYMRQYASLNFSYKPDKNIDISI